MDLNFVEVDSLIILVRCGLEKLNLFLDFLFGVIWLIFNEDFGCIKDVMKRFKEVFLKFKDLFYG